MNQISNSLIRTLKNKIIIYLKNFMNEKIDIKLRNKEEIIKSKKL